MRELIDLDFGANITGMEGGSTITTVICDDLGNYRDYALAEVDANGAVVLGDDGRYQRLGILDRKTGGVQIYRGVNDNPIVPPGEKLEVKVGSHTVVIEGTSDSNVLLNEMVPTTANSVKDLRYPKKKILV